MSEYSDASSISKFTGSNAGYVGYEDNKYILSKIKDNPNAFLYLDKMRCPLKRAEKKFRFQILVKLETSKVEELLPQIYAIVDEKSHSDVQIFTERNPQNLS